MKIKFTHIPGPDFDELVEKGIIEADGSEPLEINHLQRLFNNFFSLTTNRPVSENHFVSELWLKFFHKKIEKLDCTYNGMDGGHVRIEGAEDALVTIMFLLISQDDSLPDDDRIARAISYDMTIHDMVTFWNYAFTNFPAEVIGD